MCDAEEQAVGLVGLVAVQAISDTGLEKGAKMTKREEELTAMVAALRESLKAIPILETDKEVNSIRDKALDYTAATAKAHDDKVARETIEWTYCHSSYEINERLKILTANAEQGGKDGA